MMDNIEFERDIQPELERLHAKFLGRRVFDGVVIHDIYWHLKRSIEVKLIDDTKGYSTIHCKDFAEVDRILSSLIFKYENDGE